LKLLSFEKFIGLMFALMASAYWASLAQARDSRCPLGMHSPDGNVCVPGESMHDESEAIKRMPSGFQQPPEIRELYWSALAMDKNKLLVTNKEMKFIGVSRGHKDMKVAQKVALDMCKSDGSNHCKIIATVVNQCLAISISPEANKLEYVFNANMQLAIDGSKKKCNQQYKGCIVAYTDC
jgi:Domain of unknown function (DUF4189)